MARSSQQGKSKHFRPESEWQQIITDYERSGLTQDAYCQQSGVPKSSFYKWRKRLSKCTKDLKASDFVDLNSLVQPNDSPPWEIELNFGNGMSLRLRGG